MLDDAATDEVGARQEDEDEEDEEEEEEEEEDEDEEDEEDEDEDEATGHAPHHQRFRVHASAFVGCGHGRFTFEVQGSGFTFWVQGSGFMLQDF